MTATVTRLPAPSGNRDNDHFRPECPACGWKGALHSNRTVEGRSLAERDAREHKCKTAMPVCSCNFSHYGVLLDDMPDDVNPHGDGCPFAEED
jgi:hypothetical protein